MRKPENLEAINKSFEVQAAGFESKSVNFTNEDYLNMVIQTVCPTEDMIMLEVAAGTCAVSRSFAPQIRTSVCLDATESMLTVGKTEAEKNSLDNMVFVKGFAEELPFLSESFDLVISRLAFHHFTDTLSVMREMARVCKCGGLVVMIDMEASDEPYRDIRDKIETMRDPSHVRNLSLPEMRGLFENERLSIENENVTEMQTVLSNWMELTKTPDDIQEHITKLMEDDLAEKSKTGFEPYRSEEGICFKHKWVMLVGRK